MDPKKTKDNKHQPKLPHLKHEKHHPPKPQGVKKNSHPLSKEPKEEPPTPPDVKRRSQISSNSKRMSTNSQDEKSPYLPPSKNVKSKSISGEKRQKPGETSDSGLEGDKKHHYFDVATLKKEAPTVLGKRLKQIRDFEKANPDLQLDDELIQEYVFQESNVDEEGEIIFIDDHIKTAEELKALKKRIAERKVQRAYQRPRKYRVEDKILVEEQLPVTPPERKSSSPTELEKTHPTGKRTSQHFKPPVPRGPLSTKDREELTAKAREKLKELIKERIEMGPDPEMLKNNPAMERAVVQESLAKKALIDIANKKQNKKDQYKEEKDAEDSSNLAERQQKRRSYLNPPRNSDGELINTKTDQTKQSGRQSFSESNDDPSNKKTMKTSEKNKSKTSKDSTNTEMEEGIIKGLELEELEKIIKREEDLRKSREKGKKSGSVDEPDLEDKGAETTEEQKKPAKPAKMDESAYFKKIRGEQKPEEKEEEEAHEEEEPDKDNEGKKNKDMDKDKAKVQKGNVKGGKAGPENKEEVKDKEDDDFEEVEPPQPPVEYQDLVYGNVRFLNLNSLRPLQAVKTEGKYDEMFGMVSNPQWVKLHFVDPNQPPPERVTINKESRKQQKGLKIKAPEKEDDFAVKFTQSYLNLMKDKTGVDYDKVKVVSRIPRGQMFTRPARQVFFVELPLVQKNYGTNWKFVQHDIRKKVRKRKQLPEFLTSAMDPLIMVEMLIDRVELNDLDKNAPQLMGVKPEPRNDYFDWMIKGAKPRDQNGDNYLKDEDKQKHRNKKNKGKDWFHSPPHYKPNSPPDSLFDEYNFCGYGDRGKPYFLEFTLPRSILLYNCMYGKSDGLLQSIRKPPGSFPGYALPRWLIWPLDQKLPQHRNIPPDTLHWTRGVLGESLRPAGKGASFRLDDPCDINGQEYNALHDENCAPHMLRTSVKDHLFTSNLINIDGEVICNQKEQNQYRLYLRDSQWREECEKACKAKANSKIHQLAAYRYFHNEWRNWADQRFKWKEAIHNVKQIEEDKKKELIHKYEQVDLKTKKRLEEIKEDRELNNQERRYKNQMIYPSPSYIHQKATFEELQFHRQVNSELKQEMAADHRAAYHCEMYRRADELKRIRWQNKVISMNRQTTLNKWATDVTRVERKRKIARREETVLAHRRRLPEIMLERKLAELWLKRIVRKYAMLWLEITRKRKKDREDIKHNSRWDTSKVLGKTVEQLRQESGFKKFSNVVMNLFNSDKLKALAHPRRQSHPKPQPEPELVTLHPSNPNEFTLSKFPILASSASDESSARHGSEEGSGSKLDSPNELESDNSEVHQDQRDSAIISKTKSHKKTRINDGAVIEEDDAHGHTREHQNRPDDQDNKD